MNKQLTKKLKHLVTINELTLPENFDPNGMIQYVDIGSVDKNGKITSILEMSFQNAPSRARRILRDEDTIVSTVRTYLKAIAFIDQSSSNLIGSTGFAVLSPKNIEPKFLFYLMRSTAMIDEIVARSVGVSYPAINASDIGNINVTIPEKEVQMLVVNFLDKETSKIDKLIEKKQRLIELLQEKRQALITKAVTTGLDPHVPMKDSGIPWLGKVPEHWEVKKLKTIAHLKSGNTINYSDIEAEGNYPVYGGNGLRGYTDSFTHSGEFILIGRQGALCGNVHLVSDTFWASEHAIVVTLIKNANINWLANLLKAMNLNQYSESAAQPGISVEKIKNLYICTPPFNEQELIADFLFQEEMKINSLIEKIQTQITKLQEYRQALITAAVTGKIDVREKVSS